MTLGAEGGKPNNNSLLNPTIYSNTFTQEKSLSGLDSARVWDNTKLTSWTFNF